MYIVIPVNTILGCWFIYNMCEVSLQIHFVGNKKKLRIYIDTKPNKYIHLRWANSLRPTQVLSELLVAQSCVFCVVFCGLLFVFSSFLSMVIVLSGLCIIWHLYYLAIVLSGICIIWPFVLSWPLYYHGHCIIWHLYYLVFVLSDLCIIMAFVLSGLCIIMAIVLSGLCIIWPLHYLAFVFSGLCIIWPL
jgi:hypothetical protein